MNFNDRRSIMTLMMRLSLLICCFAVVAVSGQEFHEPETSRREATFAVRLFENSAVNQRYPGTVRYYCTFRGKWSKERHPSDFPRSPSWSAPVMISHTNGYRMWTGTEVATLGVESIAEEGFTTIIKNEVNNAGFETLMISVGERMFNTTDSQHLPPINVSFEHPFISAMVKMTPSPDWFAGFSDWRTINPVTETYYQRIVIKSYAWDCGTDAGQTYTALDRDYEQPIPISRITTSNLPRKGQFLSPDGTYIPSPGEFECILRVGDGPVVPGKPFNETEDIRPPLYVHRNDDEVEYLDENGNWVGGKYGPPKDKDDGKSSAPTTITTSTWSFTSFSTTVVLTTLLAGYLHHW